MVPALAPRKARAERDIFRAFEQPTWRSPIQVATTALGLAGGWYLTDRGMRSTIWLGLPATLIVAVFTIRAFIIFHDCGHGSFTRSRRANTIIGSAIGVVVFTPYAHWARAHARHHATSGDLDRRGSGDVWMMTTAEYEASPRRRRFAYRTYHNPVFLLSIGPLIKFVIIERLVLDPELTNTRLRLTVYLTNLAVAAYVATMCLWMGVGHFALAQLLVLAFGGIPAVYLFYVQHRFPGTYWRRHDEWDYVEASLKGSSLFVLPSYLHWVTGNIGFHHIHHLAPRIPNYSLPQAQAACPHLQPGQRVTLRTSLGALHTKLWDEARGRFVTFTEAGY